MLSFFTHFLCILIGAAIGIGAMCLVRMGKSFDEINGTPLTEDEQMQKFLDSRQPTPVVKMDGKLSHLNRPFKETEIAE